jgi:hypothetical protein
MELPEDPLTDSLKASWPDKIQKGAVMAFRFYKRAKSSTDIPKPLCRR